MRRPPTILQIVPRLDSGGAELAVIEIARALVSAGARALVLAEPGQLAPKLAAAGGELITFPAATKNPIRMLANARSISRIVQDRGIDLIHARSRAPAWSALVAARHANVPFVTTYHGAYRETNALKRFYNSVMARGDTVIANSHYTACLIVQRYGIAPERIEVIHRGVDGDAFDPHRVAPARVAVLRTQWGVAPDTPIILHAARLTRWKRQTTLIDAIAKLSDAGRLANAVVILAGRGQASERYVSALQAQIAKHGLQNTVRLVGHVEDIAAAYLAAHVTVITSTDPPEAFGRVAIEAAAMRCPVIAVDLGAPPETLLAEPAVAGDSITGWLVPPADVAALAEQLAGVLALEPNKRAAIGERARCHVLANFPVTSMQQRTLAVYDRLLGTDLESRFCRATLHNSPRLECR